jgi:hypothetical protein
MRKLVVDPAKLPKDLKIFRPKQMEQTTFIRRDVAEKIQAAGLRGFLFEEIEDYTYP